MHVGHVLQYVNNVASAQAKLASVFPPHFLVPAHQCYVSLHGQEDKLFTRLFCSSNCLIEREMSPSMNHIE